MGKKTGVMLKTIVFTERSALNTVRFSSAAFCIDVITDFRNESETKLKNNKKCTATHWTQRSYSHSTTKEQVHISISMSQCGCVI